MDQPVKSSISPDNTLYLLRYASANAAELYRVLLAERLLHITGGIVQHGPLKGFNLGVRATWGLAESGPKLLGFYEKEVCDLLVELARDRDTFINLGGGDGFYAVGLIKAGLYRESHCYEISAASRSNITAVAEANQVGGRIHLHELATPVFARELVSIGVDLKRCTVLMDIESDEFDVLTDECLHDLRDTHVIIEIHDFMRPYDGKQRYADLLRRIDRHFRVRPFTTGARNPAEIPLLQEDWTDTDRWLLCSESRPTLMTWLHLAPRESTAGKGK